MTTVFVHLPLYSLCSHYSAPRHQIVLVSHFIEKNPVGLQFLLAQFYHSCKKNKIMQHRNRTFLPTSSMSAAIPIHANPTCLQ